MRRGIFPKTVREAAQEFNDPLLNEDHHRYYGCPWSKGLCTIALMKYLGLKPQHKLLEFGCGSLRNGVHLIRYLNRNCYYGSDADEVSIAAGLRYEIPMHGLEEKGAQVWVDDTFNTDDLPRMDFVLATSVFKLHVSDETKSNAVTGALERLKNGGKLVVAGNDLTSLFPDFEYLLFENDWGKWRTWTMVKK